MKAGFFPSFLVEVSSIIDEKFGGDAVIDVKAIRKAMGIPSQDRSRVMFVAKALARLCSTGVLEQVGRNGSKRYRKARLAGRAGEGELAPVAINEG